MTTPSSRMLATLEEETVAAVEKHNGLVRQRQIIEQQLAESRSLIDHYNGALTALRKVVDEEAQEKGEPQE